MVSGIRQVKFLRGCGTKWKATGKWLAQSHLQKASEGRANPLGLGKRKVSPQDTKHGNFV